VSIVPESNGLSVQPRLGFACAWSPNEAETWSGTPFRLRAALAASGALVDLHAELPGPVRLALKAASARRVDGRWVSLWKHGRAARTLTQKRISRLATASGCEAVVTVQDLGILDVPYLIVQDLSYDALLEHVGPAGVPHFPGLTRSAIERMRDRQLQVYEQAAVLLPMSRWLAGRLVRSGVPESKIVVVNPGVNVPVAAGSPVPERRVGPVRRLLFIGRDPGTKALDLVVEAFAVLRRERGPAIALTVAGPPVWPLAGAIPDGVEFLGPVARRQVGELLDTHDLFVMPSRLEGFGIAFVEALSRGLPCIGRSAFAMPEIIKPGIGGALIDADDVGGLAATIAATLEDDELYRRCAEDVPAVRRHYTWERAAAEVRNVVQNVLK
jgi:glycosyltransferase involved in cell wall biosynthesis